MHILGVTADFVDPDYGFNISEVIVKETNSDTSLQVCLQLNARNCVNSSTVTILLTDTCKL